MNMVKKLRRKFILIATVGVVIIVVGALGLINAITYTRMESQVMSVLTYICHNDGHLPKKVNSSNKSWFDEPSWTDDTPEFSYQVRFFSVLVDSNGYAKNINIKNIASFSEDEAIEYARTTIQEAVEDGTMQGFFKKERAMYAYMIMPNQDGSYLIAILDCTRDMAAVNSFLRNSLWFGLVCIVLYVLILAGLCNLAIQPFVRNMESQKRFITNAGHELKTPIAIISANTEALEMISGKSEWTGNILKQVQRLSKLINDLIVLSKMSEEKQEMVWEDVNVSEIADSIAKSFQTMVDDQKKHLVCRIEHQVSIRSDAKRLYTLINIFVDNAVKYCDDDGTVAITVASAKKHKGAVIAVANTYVDGAHMDFSHFFERFYRGDESHNSQTSGYGIGLSMAEELAQLLKGKIHVDYKENTIIFTIKIH